DREALTLLANQMQAERTKLNTVGEELTETIGKLVDAAVASGDQMTISAANRTERGFQLVRVGVWRFLATKDATALELIKRQAPRASAGLVAVGASEPPDAIRALLAPGKAALTGYIESFDALSAALLKTEELFDKQIVPRIGAIQTTLEGMQKSLV